MAPPPAISASAGHNEKTGLSGGAQRQAPKRLSKPPEGRVGCAPERRLLSAALAGPSASALTVASGLAGGRIAPALAGALASCCGAGRAGAGACGLAAALVLGAGPSGAGGSLPRSPTARDMR